MKIHGKWKGEISLGKEYLDKANELTYFEVIFNQIRDEFKGISYDISGYGVNPDPAVISGQVSGNTVIFFKQYKTAHFLDNQGNIKFNSRQKGPKIIYKGTYNEDLKIFEGNWRIPAKKNLFGLISLTEETSGSWTMKKQTDTD